MATCRPRCRCTMPSPSGPAARTSTSAARCSRWPTRSAPCSPCRPPGAVVFDYGNNIRAQAKEAGVENAFDFPGFVPAFIRPLFCEGARAVPVGGALRRPRRHPADRRGAHRALPREGGAPSMAPHGRGEGPVPGAPGADLLAGLRRAVTGGPRLQRPRPDRAGEGADRHRARPPRLGVGRLAQSRDGGDAGRHRRGRRLAAPQRAREHVGRGELDLDPPRRRDGDRVQPARGDGRRRRRDRPGGARSWRAS